MDIWYKMDGLPDSFKLDPLSLISLWGNNYSKKK